MRQRLAITISSLVAAAILAVGLTAAGFSPLPRPATAEDAQDTATTPTVDTAASEIVEPEVVYVKPAPKPKTVVVKRRVTKPASGPATVKRQQVRSTRSRDDDYGEHREERREREYEHEHEDDD